MIMLLLILMGYTLILSITAISVLFQDDIVISREKNWPEGNIVVCSIIYSVGFLIGLIKVGEK